MLRLLLGAQLWILLLAMLLRRLQGMSPSLRRGSQAAAALYGRLRVRQAPCCCCCCSSSQAKAADAAAAAAAGGTAPSFVGGTSGPSFAAAAEEDGSCWSCDRELDGLLPPLVTFDGLQQMIDTTLQRAAALGASVLNRSVRSSSSGDLLPFLRL